MTALRLLPAFRPSVRGDCIDGPRPCPWASCRYSLLVDDISTSTGRVWEPADPDTMSDSCALDVADRGGMNGAEIAELLGVTRQAVDQTIHKAIAKLEGVTSRELAEGWTHTASSVPDADMGDAFDGEFKAAVSAAHDRIVPAKDRGSQLLRSRKDGTS